MKLLFEEYSYDLPYVQKVSLSAYFFLCEELNSAQVPYVGYFYSEQAKDSVFILPKVFLFAGEGKVEDNEIAFGKYRPEDIINVDDPNNPMRKDGFDKAVFTLSVWLYQTIQRYHARHKYSAIIENAKIQNVISNKGDSDQTFLDTMLSMLRFHKDHQNLFTYISIVNSSGNNKIHWGKTMSKVQPLIRNDVPFYAEFRNKNKTINYDEDIIILFYSALEYLKQKYCFPANVNLNYDIIKPRRVEDMIETGKGTRLLKSIRKKYFTDELVALWKLLYVFFQKAETIQKGRYHEEALLARSYNLVFEDMIDVLIGDNMPEISHLKDTKDGKRIDHIYKDDSLIPEEKIFFIGDSKYYFDDSEIVGESIHKQFTYAKNIIQYSLNIFQKPENKRNADEKKVVKELRYRDELTEGYNITPNFFIRGAIKKEYVAGGKLNINDPGLEPDPQEFQINRHFSNRLFDRDTLILQAYRINFLYVMASYARGDRNIGFKTETRKRFRDDIVRTFNDRYAFYTVTPHDASPAGVEAFVRKHFKTLIGKIYRGSDADTSLWLALEKGDDAANQKFIDIIKGDANVSDTTL